MPPDVCSHRAASAGLTTPRLLRRGLGWPRFQYGNLPDQSFYPRLEISNVFTILTLIALEVFDDPLCGAKITLSIAQYRLQACASLGKTGLLFDVRIERALDFAALFLHLSNQVGRDADILFEPINLGEVGADDYVAKPFNPHELLARIKAVLRRAADLPLQSNLQKSPVLKFWGWSLDRGRRHLESPAGVIVV